MARLKKFYDVSEVLCDASRPTVDEVSVTLDGRRLETPEDVVAFFDAMRASRAVESVDG